MKRAFFVAALLAASVFAATPASAQYYGYGWYNCYGYGWCYPTNGSGRYTAPPKVGFGYDAPKPYSAYYYPSWGLGYGYGVY